jgi:hypothetical protein
MTRRPTIVMLVALLAFAFGALGTLGAFAAGLALADGDPASDVLLGEDVYYPYSPPVAKPIAQTLNAEAAASDHDKYRIKVAIIGQPVDLGTVPDLFGEPQKYADFLVQEISFESPQHLLVVMKAGYGLQGLPEAVGAAVAKVPPPKSGSTDDLARAAITAVAAIAKAAGHPISGVSGVPGSSSGGASPALLVLILALVALAAAGGVILLRRRQAAASP